MRRHQLRIYAIKEGLMEEWIAFWRTEIMPARYEHGFELVSAWTSDANEFLWILAAGDDAAAFEQLEAAYREARASSGTARNPLDYLADDPRTYMLDGLDSRRSV